MWAVHHKPTYRSQWQPLPPQSREEDAILLVVGHAKFAGPESVWKITPRVEPEKLWNLGLEAHTGGSPITHNLTTIVRIRAPK